MSKNGFYWLISVPELATKGKAFESLKAQIQKSATLFKFNVPDLRVGTLDALMSLSDDLQKYDSFIESVTRKIAGQLFQLCDGEQPLIVNGASPDVYLNNFKWDEAKYPVKPHLREICELINSGVSKLDEEIRSKSQQYATLAHSIAAEERKQAGNLLTRDLSDIVKPSDVVQDSEFLTTIFVVVPKYTIKEFESTYETMTAFVVPRSAKKLYEDGEACLYAVVIFKRVVDDFKNLAREKRFTVRDWKFSAEGVSGKEARKKLADEKDKTKNKLILWCKTNFQEAFIGWLHLKAIRVFVESILRYGLPANFQAILVLSHKKDDKNLRKELSQIYKGLGSVHTQNIEEESVGSDVFYPYVYLTLNADFSSAV